MYRTVKVVAGSPEHRKLAAEGWERTLTANGRIMSPGMPPKLSWPDGNAE